MRVVSRISVVAVVDYIIYIYDHYSDRGERAAAALSHTIYSTMCVTLQRVAEKRRAPSCCTLCLCVSLSRTFYYTLSVSVSLSQPILLLLLTAATSCYFSCCCSLFVYTLSLRSSFYFLSLLSLKCRRSHRYRRD